MHKIKLATKTTEAEALTIQQLVEITKMNEKVCSS